MTESSERGARRPLRMVRVPSVVGLPERDARVVLETAGLVRVRSHMVRGYASEHEVVRQRPEPGDLVDRGREVTLHVSRQSIVEFLPSSYQKAAENDGEFLTGFLYIAQEIGDRVERRLSQIHELFDPRHTDADFLPWLGSWLAITLNPDWTDLQRRKMLMAAAKLFPHRGTPRAIAEFVRIYTGANVQIRENEWPFPGFRVGVHSTVGEHTVILPAMNLSHCFVVQLDQAASQVSEDDIVRIHQIIGAQKPAHTAYFLSFSDEAEAGTMGTFIEIGMGAIGVGVDGAELVGEVAEPSAPPTEEIPSPKAKRTKRSQRTAGREKESSSGGGNSAQTKEPKGSTGARKERASGAKAAKRSAKKPDDGAATPKEKTRVGRKSVASPSAGDSKKRGGKTRAKTRKRSATQASKAGTARSERPAKKTSSGARKGATGASEKGGTTKKGGKKKAKDK